MPRKAGTYSWVQWLKIRWEFMRRSPNYVGAYRKWAVMRDKADSPDATDADRFELSALEQAFRDYFRVPEPMDPLKSFDDLCGGNTENVLSWPAVMAMAVLQISGVTFASSNEDKLLTITINFDQVNSPDKLKSYITSHIDMRWKLYCQSHGKKSTIKKFDYERILQAGELSASGLNEREIAERMFPEHFADYLALEDDDLEAPEQNRESKQKLVGQYLNKFNRLVNGGYRTIQYP